MEKILDLFECQIGDTANAYPSIFSKDDVVSLLIRIKESVLAEVAELKPTVSITEEKFQEFDANVRASLEKSLNNGSIDIYDYSSAEFSISYDNRVEIESLDFNTDAVIDVLDDILLTEFQAIFGDLITNNEE
jgi:hypothetical protein